MGLSYDPLKQQQQNNINFSMAIILPKSLQWNILVICTAMHATGYPCKVW